MNATLEVIHNRRSVRKYDPTPLVQEEKDAILQAAMRAPTAGNMMLYSIIEVEDQALKDKLAVSCDNQPFIAAAPYVLLFVADYQRWMDLFAYSAAGAAAKAAGVNPRLPQEGDLLLACCDALIAAQNAVIAAESLGIGSCYIGDILENCETHRAMFQLPRYTLPVGLLCFGRPAVAREEVRLTRRYDRQYIVFQDRYRRLEECEIPQMLRATTAHQFPDLSAEEGAKTFIEKLYLRKFVSDFSAEMTRSVRRWIAAWVDGEESERL
jgi:FMN reductase (NADPH)/FMN reductase [NAD(P)H]